MSARIFIACEVNFRLMLVNNTFFVFSSKLHSSNSDGSKTACLKMSYDAVLFLCFSSKYQAVFW